MTHDPLAAGWLDTSLKADVAQVSRAPFCGRDARLMMRGIGGNARNGQELEQPVERALPSRGKVIEDA
jgi:hypothetical protein